MKNFIFLTTSIFFSLVNAASPSLAKTSNDKLNLFQTASQLFVELKKDSPLIIEANKQQISEALGSDSKQKGKFYFQDKKFRWEVKEPTPSFVIYDGSAIWSVQSPPPGFEGGRQVLKSKVNKSFNDQLLIMNLLGGEHLKKAFKHSKTSLENNLYAVQVEPLQKIQDLKQLTIFLNKSKNEIKKISFSDEIGNLTEIEFALIKKRVSLKPRVFQFKPEKTDQISEL